MGGDRFSSTPLGVATRQAIEQAVAFIVQAMEQVPWSARVVEVAGEESPLGEIQVVTVQEKFSIARMKAPFPTRRGDLVKLPGQ